MTQDLLLPRVLLTNDDGFDAPGLQVLADIAATIAQEVWIVAPEEDQSGASGRISLRDAVRVTQRGDCRWAVRGSPSDCVAMALDHLMDQNLPTLVLSGVNATSNIGDEVNMSGTIGAAMTALMMGIPAIAISQDGPSRKDIPWDTTRAILPLILRPLLEDGWRKETILSINIPNLPPEKIVGYSWGRQGRKNVFGVKANRRISPRDEEYFWLTLKEKPPEAQANDELAIMKRGEVAIVMLSADRSLEVNKPSRLFNEPEPVEGEEPLDQDLLADRPSLLPEPDPDSEPDNE